MEKIDCYACKGKGTIPRIGLFIVIDWPCSICKSTGKIDNPQNAPQPQLPPTVNAAAPNL